MGICGNRSAGTKTALKLERARSMRLLPREHSVFSSLARRPLMMKLNMNVMQEPPSPQHCLLLLVSLILTAFCKKNKIKKKRFTIG